MYFIFRKPATSGTWMLLLRCCFCFWFWFSGQIMIKDATYVRSVSIIFCLISVHFLNNFIVLFVFQEMLCMPWEAGLRIPQMCCRAGTQHWLIPALGSMSPVIPAVVWFACKTNEIPFFFGLILRGFDFFLLVNHVAFTESWF